MDVPLVCHLWVVLAPRKESLRLGKELGRNDVLVLMIMDQKIFIFSATGNDNNNIYINYNYYFVDLIISFLFDL